MKERTVKKASADKKDTRTETRLDVRNPYGRDNVNVPMGPRTGNEGAHSAKRGNFLDQKAEREPVAKTILAAFAGRAAELEANPGEHEVPGDGSISSNTMARFATRKKLGK
jgi:hypothetical protein